MKFFVSNLMERIVGDARKFPLEQRLFNTVNFANGTLNIGGAFLTVFVGETLLLFPLHFITGILFLLIWHQSRWKNRYRKLLWPFMILLVLFLSANWFSNAGSYGGAHYYLIAAMIISVMLSRGWKMLSGVIVLFLSDAVLLIAMEFLHPEWVTYHDSRIQRYQDIMMNFTFVELFAGFLVVVLIGALNQERKKSDQLLQNILPESVAEELKKDGAVRPKHFHEATVIFTDFVGFTAMAESMAPQDLLFELDDCFRSFDAIVQKYGIEKVKTIGDSYMAVCGVPEPVREHEIRAVLAGLEMVDSIASKRARMRLQDRTFWDVRVGIHTGPLVAGVIGSHKFAYDVWGDTVNVASRMESSGEPGKVNISGDLYIKLKKYFLMQYRGKREAKGKGALDMFLVGGLLPEYRDSENSALPKRELLQEIGVLKK